MILLEAALDHSSTESFIMKETRSIPMNVERRNNETTITFFILSCHLEGFLRRRRSLMAVDSTSDVGEIENRSDEKMKAWLLVETKFKFEKRRVDCFDHL